MKILWLLLTIFALTENIAIVDGAECDDFRRSIISRSAWGAQPPKDRTTFNGPAPFVIIHHSFRPDVQLTSSACSNAMRSIQKDHQNVRGWSDIGFSFAVCGDGKVYEGRGFNVVGAHTINYNNRSIGLLLIGDFTSKQPPPLMVNVAQEFIRKAAKCGYLRNDYILYGHRQVRNTECPGNAFYPQMTKWPHWKA